MPNASELNHNLDDVALHHDMMYCGDKWVCTLKVHASLIWNIFCRLLLTLGEYLESFRSQCLLQCVSKKVYTFQKSPHINISTYFQEIFIHVGSYMSLLSYDTKKSYDIVCLSEQEPHLWNWPKSRLDRNWYLFCLLSVTLRVVKGFEIIILMV